MGLSDLISSIPIVKMFKWLFGIWDEIPKDTQKDLVEVVVKGFKTIFKLYFEYSKGGI